MEKNRNEAGALLDESRDGTLGRIHNALARCMRNGTRKLAASKR